MRGKTIEFPIRINRFLYLKGYCSRRKADDFIDAGKVFINGKQAEIGQKVHKNDNVTVSKELEKLPETYEYVLFNKPVGVVSHNPQEGEKSVEHYTKRPDLAPVGRLDKASRGLMLLTNDGRIVNALLSPERDHEKEYLVTVNKELKPSTKNKLEKGVNIEGYITKPAQVKILGSDHFSITLTEGKKHQIRRMVTALGYEVHDLRRVRIMNLRLGNLTEGNVRSLNKKEQETLLAQLSISNPL